MYIVKVTTHNFVDRTSETWVLSKDGVPERFEDSDEAEARAGDWCFGDSEEAHDAWVEEEGTSRDEDEPSDAEILDAFFND